jgi:simple sugar transport system ATP-binding protein
VLARGAKIIILDEPTAVLTPIETEEFFNQLKLLKADGCSVCIITHRLKEIKQICDRVTIMQNGESKGVYNVSDVTEEEISRLMVGKNVNLKITKEKAKPQDPVLKVLNLTVTNDEGKKTVNDISFTVRKGEIVCFAGVEGNGQRETVQCITGLSKKYRGQILINGKDINKSNVLKIRQCGLAHIPEDRMTYGANPLAAIFDNLISYKISEKDNTKLGFIKTGKLKKRAVEQIKSYNIKCKDSSQQINMLSGGNMQKVVVAREVDSDPVILIADQPTRGVDVGAIEFIHKKLVELRDQNKAILLISADLSEVFNLADRIFVFYNGEISGCFTDIDNLTDIEIGKYMLGIKKMTKEEISKVNNG